MKKNEGLHFSIFMFLFGMIFVIVSLLFLNNYNNFIKTAVKQKAIISNITTSTNNSSSNSDSHTVYVTYTYEGKEYTESLNYYSSSMNIGDETTIYVNPENPGNIKGSGQQTLILVFFIIGSAFVIAAIIIALIFIRKKIFNKKLLENGKLIYAEIINISVNSNVNINRQQPFIITCKWKDPQTCSEYIYKSQNIWINPEPFLKEHSIDHLIVYIDEQNPKKYFISLEELNKILDNSNKARHNPVQY